MSLPEPQSLITPHTEYQIIPAILRTDPEQFAHDLIIAQNFASIIQIDIVDQSYAEQPTVGLDVIISNAPQTPIEIDLLVEEPDVYVTSLLDVSFIKRIVIHTEKAQNLQTIIDQCHAHGKECAVAFNVGTSIEILPTLRQVDQITCMSVEPGLQAQPFLAGVLPKIRDIRTMFPYLPIEVDGHIDDQTIAQAKEAGATRFACGSYILKSEDPKAQYERLNQVLKQA